MVQRVVGKVPLFECEIAMVNTSDKTPFVRVLVGGKESKGGSNQRSYTISGQSPEDTADWSDVLKRQKKLVEKHVSMMTFEVSPGARVIDKASLKQQSPTTPATQQGTSQ